MLIAIRSDIQSIDPSEVPLWVTEITTEQYFDFATAVVLIYHAITTMDKEVKYFWGSPWGTVNFVYYVNRYIGILGAIAFIFWDTYESTLALCNFAQWTRSISNWITIVLVDYILMIRVLALYCKHKKLSVCLGVLLVLESCMKLGIMIYGTVIQQITIVSLSTTIVCAENNFIPVRWGIVDWSLPLTYGVVLMVLALYKGAQYWKTSAGLKGFPLVKVLIQDQLIYFMLAVFCCAINILQYEIIVENNFLAAILLSLGNPSFLCVLGSHMLFNLKEAGRRGLNEGTSIMLSSHCASGMEFGREFKSESEDEGTLGNSMPSAAMGE